MPTIAATDTAGRARALASNTSQERQYDSELAPQRLTERTREHTCQFANCYTDSRRARRARAPPSWRTLRIQSCTCICLPDRVLAADYGRELVQSLPSLPPRLRAFVVHSRALWTRTAMSALSDHCHRLVVRFRTPPTVAMTQLVRFGLQDIVQGDSLVPKHST